MATYVVLGVLALVVIAIGVGQYRAGGRYGELTEEKPGIQRDYDADGQLQRIVYDAHGRHRPDTWSYFSGGRVVRTDVDEDGDGLVDTWYYYDADGNVTKTGFSTKHDGVVDAWRFETPDGDLVRIEYSGRRDGRITRSEFYEHNTVIRVADVLGDHDRN